MAVTYAQMMQAARAPQPHIVIRSVEHPIEVWTDAHRWIDAALDAPLALIGADDVFNKLLSKQMELWAIYSHGALCGAFVTQIEAGSKGRALNVIALGGENMTEWLDYVVEVLSMHGREKKCKYVIEMGRQGWTRVLERFDWQAGPAIMLKVL